jgi:hypothetical protein
MTITSQKLELIQWISNLDNVSLLKEIAKIRNRVTSQNTEPKRFFGCGKDIVLGISEDFNEPLDHFNEYQP